MEVIEVLYQKQGKGIHRATMSVDQDEELSENKLKQSHASDIVQHLDLDDESDATFYVSRVRVIREGFFDTGLADDERILEDEHPYFHTPSKGELLPYTLTEKGFSIAHDIHQNRRHDERQQRRTKRQHEVNRAIGFLTLGLVLVNFIQTVMTGIVGFGSPLWQANVIILVGTAVIVGIAYLLTTSGMLSQWNPDEVDKFQRISINKTQYEE
jgi:hypothetical protein